MVNNEFIIKKPDNWQNLPLYQKIQYYGQNMNELYAKYVDKIEAKKIIKDICGDDIKVAKIVKILRNPTDIAKEELHNHLIIKSAHGSGWNLIINNNDLKNVHKTLKSWNKVYSRTEKQYAYLVPRFFIEEIIDDKYYGKNGNAVVYMFRCIYGKVISVSSYLKHTGQTTNYDREWNVHHKNDLPHIIKPVHFDKMIKYAEILSSPFEFVRIDFHIDKNDDVYFSEFTFTPLAGQKVFSDDLEKKLGETWI